MASMYKAVVLALVVEKSLEDICAVVVFSFGSIVGPAVGEHPLHVCYEQAFVHIVISLQPLRHGFHVHRELHVLIVVRHSLPVHGVEEGPGVLVVPAGGQDGLQGVIELVWVNLVVTILGCPSNRKVRKYTKRRHDHIAFGID